jgi:hypothetical protein
MATGRRSNAICDRCGFRCKYIELRNEVEVGGLGLSGMF